MAATGMGRRQRGRYQCNLEVQRVRAIGKPHAQERMPSRGRVLHSKHEVAAAVCRRFHARSAGARPHWACAECLAPALVTTPKPPQ